MSKDHDEQPQSFVASSRAMAQQATPGMGKPTRTVPRGDRKKPATRPQRTGGRCRQHGSASRISN